MGMLYRLTNLPPLRKGDVFTCLNKFYRVKHIEPMIYRFRAMQNDVEVGFKKRVYYLDELKPPKNVAYYIRGVGIDGNIEILLTYPEEKRHLNAEGVIHTRLTPEIAPYDKPFQVDVFIDYNIRIGIDVYPEFEGVKASVWFYGYKILYEELETPPTEQVIQLESITYYAR